MAHKDIYGPGANPEVRVVKSYEQLCSMVTGLRGSIPGIRIVLVSGTWDLIHVGHARYLGRAKDHGDVIIVGVDSDEKTRRRKGPHRPVVPEEERVEMLTHLRHVDLVVIKPVDEPKYRLVQCIKPDVLITVEGTHNDDERDELRKHCGEVVVLPEQATTSTTAKVRRLLLDFGAEVRSRLEDTLAYINERMGGEDGKK